MRKTIRVSSKVEATDICSDIAGMGPRDRITFELPNGYRAVFELYFGRCGVETLTPTNVRGGSFSGSVWEAALFAAKYLRSH